VEFCAASRARERTRNRRLSSLQPSMRVWARAAATPVSTGEEQGGLEISAPLRKPDPRAQIRLHGVFGLDLERAYQEKMTYNRTGVDHIGKRVRVAIEVVE